jgi:hypothetical protein
MDNLTNKSILMNIEINGILWTFPLILYNSHKPIKPYYMFKCLLT